MPSLNLNIGDQVRAAFKPAQDTLFDLLRGIRQEQVKTNTLLTAFLAFEAARPDATAEQFDIAALMGDAMLGVFNFKETEV